MRAAVVPVLTLALACKPGSPAGATASDGAAPSGAQAVVAKTDCATWSKHGVDTLLADWAAAAAGCPAAQRATIVDKLESQRVTIQEAAMTVCMGHLGASYGADDARCYLAARTARALAACHFPPMTNPGDTDMGAEIDKVRALCTQGAPPSPPPQATGRGASM